MKKFRLLSILPLVAILAIGLTTQAQETLILMDQLGSNSTDIRAEAYQELVQMGPPAIGALIEGVGGENLTADKWAKIAIEKIANQSAAPGACESKKAVVNELLNVLLDRRSSPQVNFALQTLTWVGCCKAVGPISAYLNRPAEREKARYALERIPGDAATNALIRAVDLAACSCWKSALIKTLGARGDANAIGTVEQAFKDINPSVRLVAITAAGSLKTPKAASGLWRFMAKGNFNEQRAAANALLTLAEDLAAIGETKAAAKIFMRFYEKVPVQHLRCAGLVGLSKSLGPNAYPILIQALHDEDNEIVGSAFDVFLNKKCPHLTGKLVKTLKATTGLDRISLIRLLAMRDDPAAGEAASMLLYCFNNFDGDIRKEAKQALVSIPGAETTRTLMFALDKAETVEAQVELLNMLGDRAPIGAIVVFTDASNSKDAAIRAAGMEALAKLNRKP